MTWEKWLIIMNPHHSSRTSIKPRYTNQATSSYYMFMPTHIDQQKSNFSFHQLTKRQVFPYWSNQSTSTTNNTGGATFIKFLSILTNVNLHQPKRSNLLLTLHLTKPQWPTLSRIVLKSTHINPYFAQTNQYWAILSQNDKI